jgi:hypothetical protein
VTTGPAPPHRHHDRRLPAPAAGIVYGLCVGAFTHFNFYSAPWTNGIMRDTAAYILDVSRRRAEAAPAPPG